jgi:hypothetical protein
VRHPDGQTEFTGQPKNAANMIAMLMRNENASQIRWVQTKALQTGSGFPQTETAIKHQAGRPVLDEQCITRTATAERGEANHCNC